MRTAMRALLLAVVLVVVPASVAYAGIKPGPNYPVTTTKPSVTSTNPSSSSTLPEGTRPLQNVTAPGLAKTGSDSTPLVWAGVAALAVGGVLVIGARRRAAVRR